MDWIQENEAGLRLACFVSVLLLMLFWESKRPLRNGETGRFLWHRRWQHVALTALNTAALRLMPGLAAVQAALLAENAQWGLLQTFDWQHPLVWLATFLALDCAIYWQHRVFHRVPALWRLHRLHHTDADFDTTTALRFHPIEIALSMLIKFAVVLALGAPVWLVILFEVLLNASALFNHGNVSVPARIEKHLRKVIVTPDMHRVHHSPYPHETNSNYGFHFPWWDRLFGSYRANPDAPHQSMDIGLHEFPRESTQRFRDLLWQPFAATPPAADHKADTPSSTN